jgi:putative transposase
VGSASPSYKGHRYPVEIISHCVWLYFRFPLSFREVEELMLERGVIVSYETIRRWCLKFGQQYANSLRRCRPRPGDKWHLDEVFVKINGEQKYLWRAVAQDGMVLDILVQNRRGQGRGQALLPSAPQGDRVRAAGGRHRQAPLLRRRPPRGHALGRAPLPQRPEQPAENSHQPTRQRERAMKGFRSAGGAQRFLSAFSNISPHFRPHRHLMTAHDYRAEMTIRFAIWEQITGVSGPSTMA